MAQWISDRLPTQQDADLHGQVRWNPKLPGMLMHWLGVRQGELWAHTSAWKQPKQ